MDSIDYKHITEIYNQRRKELPFATIDASENVIRYLFTKYLDHQSLTEDQMVEKIGRFINWISFD